MGCCPIVAYQPEQEGTFPPPPVMPRSSSIPTPQRMSSVSDPEEISLGDIFDLYQKAHPERFRSFIDCPPLPSQDEEVTPGPRLQRKNHIIRLPSQSPSPTLSPGYPSFRPPNSGMSPGDDPSRLSLSERTPKRYASTTDQEPGSS